MIAGRRAQPKLTAISAPEEFFSISQVLGHARIFFGSASLSKRQALVAFAHCDREGHGVLVTLSMTTP
jgi:hypothetical protein